MSKDQPRDDQGLSREERLAAKLRENLHRRKAQARAMAAPGESDSPPRPAPDGE